jgi:hypothetical protein
VYPTNGFIYAKGAPKDDDDNLLDDPKLPQVEMASTGTIGRMVGVRD